MAVKTCKKDCSPENKDKFLSEAGMPFRGVRACSDPHQGSHSGAEDQCGVCSTAVVGC